MTKLRYIDLFSGIGGMRLAFERAASNLGIEAECVFSSEINTDARFTYENNFSHQLFGDIRLVESLPEYDVLLAGFPCQSFSYAGKKEGFADHRGMLFFEICRLIDINKPKALIFENVSALLTNDAGQTFATIKDMIEQRGYIFKHFILNSCNFGLPQNRPRLYMVGLLGKNPQFNLNLTSDKGPKDSNSGNLDKQLTLFDSSSSKKSLVVANILEANPDASYDCSLDFVSKLKTFLKGDLNRLHGVRLIDYRGGNSIHSWDLGLRGSCTADEIELMNKFILERRKKKFGQYQDGKLLTKEQIATFFSDPNLDTILDSLVSKRYLSLKNGMYKPTAGNFSFEVYKFLDPSKISVAVVSSDANRLGVYHLGRVRKLTPREIARLQGFPDTFRLHPNDDKAYFQLGNAVSINVAEAVATEVMINVVSSR